MIDEAGFCHDFSARLSQLRMQKGVSARDMSLSIGQNAGYINNIETGKALPSMMGFVYICDYLGISPKEFFDYDTKDPTQLDALHENLKRLNARQLQIVSLLVEEFLRNR